MRNTVELRDEDIDLVVAALLSMSCPLCPLHPKDECSDGCRCRKLTERIVGGDLAEVFGMGGE